MSSGVNLRGTGNGAASPSLTCLTQYVYDAPCCSSCFLSASSEAIFFFFVLLLVEKSQRYRKKRKEPKSSSSLQFYQIPFCLFYCLVMVERRLFLRFPEPSWFPMYRAQNQTTKLFLFLFSFYIFIIFSPSFPVRSLLLMYHVGVEHTTRISPLSTRIVFVFIIQYKC